MGKRGGGGECFYCFTHGFSGFPLLLSFFLQTAPHVTTLLQIYSDLCAHQNLQKRPIQLKFKMSQHHSEKMSVDQTDSRKQRKNFVWWWICDAFILWVFYPILCLFVAITSRRFSSVFVILIKTPKWVKFTIKDLRYLFTLSFDTTLICLIILYNTANVLTLADMAHYSVKMSIFKMICASDIFFI